MVKDKLLKTLKSAQKHSMFVSSFDCGFNLKNMKIKRNFAKISFIREKIVAKEYFAIQKHSSFPDSILIHFQLSFLMIFKLTSLLK